MEWDVFAGTQQFHSRNMPPGRNSHGDALLADGVELPNPALERAWVGVVEHMEREAGLGFPGYRFGKPAALDLDRAFSLGNPANCIPQQHAQIRMARLPGSSFDIACEINQPALAYFLR